jgi:tRNA-specific adenosine deaminase 1
VSLETWLYLSTRPLTGNVTYRDLKHRSSTALYQQAKAVLRGSLLLAGGSDGQDSIAPGFMRSGEVDGSPPFVGWIVTGRDFESFTVDGKVVVA